MLILIICYRSLLESENDVTVKAALIRYWHLTSRMSDHGLTRLLKMLSVIHPNGHWPSSSKVLKSRIQHLFVDKSSDVFTERFDDVLIDFADFEGQIKIILSNFQALMIKYSLKFKYSLKL